jgi:hypothetical protein
MLRSIVTALICLPTLRISDESIQRYMSALAWILASVAPLSFVLYIHLSLLRRKPAFRDLAIVV